MFQSYDVALTGSDIKSEAKIDLVSVIIPAYNHQLYIKFCLDSILNDGYRNIEIILIDDGSRDSTFQIAKDWMIENQSKFAKVHIETQENSGLSNTLNKLISLASGEYITLLASDDALVEGSIGKRMSFLKQNNKRVVIGNCFIINEDSEIMSSNGISYMHNGSLSALADPKRLPGELILHWSVPGPVMLAHRSIYDDNKRYEKYNPSFAVEDRYWYLDVISKNDLIFLNAPVAYYRVHTSNTSSNIRMKRNIIKDILDSERSMISRFNGVRRLMLYIVYLRSLYILKVHDNPNFANRVALLVTKIICRIAIFLNRNT